MFPIILSNLEEDDDELLVEANSTRDNSVFNEGSSLYRQDNLRCNVGRRILRRFSSEQSNRSTLNHLNKPGERIIEIKSESEDDEDINNIATSSTAVSNDRTNLLNNDHNDYRYQRFRPIRIREHDLTTSDQPRFRSNYQVLKSKKRFTFPICFFVSLYVAFLVLSSLIFTKFEQKLVNTDHFFEIQKNLMESQSTEQYDQIQQLIEHSVKLQKSGVDVIGILKENRILINKMMIESTGNQVKSNDNQIWTKSNNLNSHQTYLLTTPSTLFNTIDIENFTKYGTINETNNRNEKQDNSTTNQMSNRKTYNWDLQQALFYVVSIATTIGYGNLVPDTNGGKIYSIIFGLISIPYTTILFSIIVSKFSNGPLRRFKLSLLTNHFTEKSHETLRIIRFICLFLATLFILVFVLGLPAILFGKMEKKWSYLDCFYFIFISITTVGLGDYTPGFFGTLHYWFYEFVVILFLYFGIIIIMLWLTLIKSVFRKSISIKLDEYDRDEEDRHEAILEEQVLINYHYHQKNYINYGSFYGYDEVEVRLPK